MFSDVKKLEEIDATLLRGILLTLKEVHLSTIVEQVEKIKRSYPMTVIYLYGTLYLSEFCLHNSTISVALHILLLV